MEIKDRVAINDDCFVVQDIVTGEIKDYVRLIRRPSEVIEEGTPINKELLQPLFDVVDISSDFCTLIYDGPFNYRIETIAHKIGNVISGFIAVVNDDGEGLVDEFNIQVPSKYRSTSLVFIPLFGFRCDAEDGNFNISSNAFAIMGGYGIQIPGFSNLESCDGFYMSFIYLCVGENDNGDS